MSATIDTKVVEMKFDNSEFDKNIQSSMQSLDKLDKALNAQTDTSKMSKLQGAVKNVDFSSMYAAIDTINDRFSTMGIIGMTVISRLTNAAMDMGKKIITAIPSQIAHGGWQRALNVEDAKFRLEGLKIAWDDVADDIDHAVKDTAYGADEASKAASMLAASGVAYGGIIDHTKDGKPIFSDMGRALHAISATAAMTNSSYSEMADIFSTVAGQGKLMTMQMRQLESRGLNVAATLGHVWGKSEAEVRDMVTKGKVNFQMFADAMDEAFGDQAQKANETMSGSMANMKAALSRIGQDFASTIQTQTPQVFNSLKGFFNQIRNYTKPFAEQIFGPMFTKNMEVVSSVIDTATSKLPDITSWGGKLQFGVAMDALRDIMEGLETTFYSFLYALTPIGDAFHKVFGDVKPLKNLRDFSIAFKEFSEGLLMSDSTMDKLRRTFSGVFAVLDIGIQLIKSIVGAILPATSGVKGIASSFLDFTANLGDNLVALDNWIKKENVFSGIFDKIKSKIAPIADFMKNAFSGVLDIFGGFSGVDLSGLTTFTDKAKAIFSSFLPAFSKIGDYFKSLSPILKAVGNLIGSVIGGAINTVSKLIDSFLGGANFKTLTDLLNGLAAGALTLSLKRTFDFFRGISQSIVRPIDRISSVLLSLKGVFVQLQADIKADILKRIAIAIGILAASVWLLSTIDPEALGNSVAAMAGLASTLVASFAAFSKMQKSFDVFKIGAMSAAFISLGVAILLLSVGVKILASIPMDQMMNGLIGIAALLAMLAGEMLLFSKIEGKVKKSAVTMIAMAIAINILASAVKKLSELDIDELAKGVIAVGALMLTLAASMAIMGKSGKMGIGDALSLIAMAAALKIIASAVQEFASMDLMALIQGMGATIVALFALAGAMALIGKFGGAGALAASVGILITAAALEIIANVVSKFGAMDMASLTKGMYAMIVSIVAMAAAMVVLGEVGPIALLGAAGMLVMAAAMAVLSVPIIALSKLKIGDLVKGILGMVSAMLAIGLASVVLGVAGPTLILAAAGIAAISAAFMLFIPAMMMLSTLKFTSVLKGLGMLLVVSIALIPAAAVLALLAPVLITASLGMATFAASMLLVGAAMGALASGLMALNAMMEAADFETIMANLNTVIIGILDILIAATPKIMDLLCLLLDGLLGLLMEYVPKISETAALLILGIITGFGQHMNEISLAALELISNLLLGMAEGFDALTDAAMILVVDFIQSLANALINNVDALMAAVDDLIYAIAYAFGAGVAEFNKIGETIVLGIAAGLGIDDEAISSAEQMINNVWEAIKSVVANAWELGKDLVDGFIQGIQQAPGKIWDAGVNLAKSALGGIAAGQRSNSPAKEGIEKGEDLGDGYNIGIMGKLQEARDSGEKLAKSATEGMDTGADKAELMAEKRITRLTDQYEKAGGKMEAISGYTTQTVVNGYKKEETALDKLMKKLGVEVKDTKAAAKAKEEAAKAADENSKSNEKLADSLDGTAKSAKKAKDEIKDFHDNLEKGLESKTGGMNFFKKLELSASTSAETILENMKSNVDGVASWTHRLGELMKKGLDKDMVKTLADAGLDSYDQITAFLSMTDEQIQEANELFKQAAGGRAYAANELTNGWINAAKMSTKGFTDYMGGKGAEEMKEESREAGEKAIEGVNEGAGVASPSWKTRQTAIYTIQGFINGFNQWAPKLYNKATEIAKEVVEIFNLVMDPKKSVGIANYWMQGLIDGLEENSDALAQVAEKNAKLIEKATATKLEIESPSKVGWRLGKYWDLGIAKGISDNANEAVGASVNIADRTVDSIKSMVKAVNKIVADDISDMNPVIRPVLDTSELLDQVGQISSLFNGHEAQIKASVNGVGSSSDISDGTKSATATYNFTQNNYSPKALDRGEIYRRTNNQLSMLNAVRA